MGKLLDSEDEIERKYQADFWRNIVGARTSFGTILKLIKGERQVLCHHYLDYRQILFL